MQVIPGAKYNMNKYEEHMFTFGGLKHSEGAKDGAIYDLENMALDESPSLTVRKKRQKLSFDMEGTVYGIGSGEKLFWCAENSEGETSFYYDGEEKFPLSATEKTFAVVNKYVCIFPDKKYFSLWQSEAVNLKAEEGITLYTSLKALNAAKETDDSIKDGDVYAVGDAEPYSFFQFNSQGKWDSDSNTNDHAKQTRWIYLMDSWGSLDEKLTVPYDLEGTSMEGFNTEKIDVDDYGEIECLGLMTGASGQYAERFAKWIRPGDLVRFTKVKLDGEVSVSYVKFIKKVNSGSDTKSYTYFAFDPVVITTSTSGYKEISIERVIPDLEHSFCHDNRLWGCEKDKIYASSLGDPFNFTDYSLVASSAWTVGVASFGEFTGGIAYNGYPTFFKEDSIIRVSGDYPSQYSTFETADIPGVLKGCGKSLAITNGYLYYLSPEGVCAYSGSYPTLIGEDIGEVLVKGVSGAGSDKYFLEAENAKGDKALYVYDTRHRAWTKEDSFEASGFTDMGRDLYAVAEDGIYLLDSEKDMGDAEADFESFTEFAPIYDGSLSNKGVSKLHISLSVDSGARVSVSVSYDGGEWIKVSDIAATKRKNVNIPLTLRRCGTYRLKIEGKGSYTVYGIGRVRYYGSDM